MHITSRYSLFFKIFLSLGLLFTQTTYSADFGLNSSIVTNATMRATIGCGGAALGSSFGPVGTITGIIVGGLIGFLVNKCARKTDHKYDGLLFNDMTGETNKVPAKTVEDIIGESKPIGKTKGPSTQYEKEGSYEDALKDFEALAPQNIQNIERNNVGRWGDLPDGRRVVVRVESSGRVPTLEIQIPGKINKIKIRYVKS